MKFVLKLAAAAVIVAGTAFAQQITNGDQYPDERMPAGLGSTDAVSAKATCELDNGFGLMAFTTDTDLLEEIQARLDAGDTVAIQVDGTDVIGLMPGGNWHVLGIVTGPGGQPVVCYQTF